MNFLRILIITVTSVTLLSCVENQQINEAKCINIIEGITEMPFKNDLPAEGNYFELISKAGDKYITRCLLSQVTNTSPIPDPRKSVPNKREFVAIGDVATFMLTEMYEIPYTKFIDESEWEQMGVFAYFRYVETEGARERIQSVLTQEIQI